MGLHCMPCNGLIIMALCAAEEIWGLKTSACVWFGRDSLARADGDRERSQLFFTSIQWLNVLIFNAE